jgi:hypothetical protein
MMSNNVNVDSPKLIKVQPLDCGAYTIIKQRVKDYNPQLIVLHILNAMKLK